MNEISFLKLQNGSDVRGVAVDGVENGIDAFADKVPGTYNVFE